MRDFDNRAANRAFVLDITSRQPSVLPVPVPDSIMNLIAHRAAYMKAWKDALDGGLSANESRTYAQLELDRMLKAGELKGESLFTKRYSPPPSAIPSEDPTSMFYTGRKTPHLDLTLQSDESERPLGPNPSHAPLKIDRRPLRLKPLKPRVPRAAPIFPFVKDTRTAEEKALS